MGFSEARLERMQAVLAGHVEHGGVPGIVSVVSRRGEIRVETVGVKALGDTTPIARDTIFRIASMTKPITAAAAMILVEECVLRLDDPVDRLLPELADRRVLRRIDSPLEDTVAANRPIVVRDLLTFLMGFGAVAAPPGTYPIQGALRESRLGGDGPPDPATCPAPDEWMRRLGELPLMYQPGEAWTYNTAADVLGVLIARASGQSFGAFLSERVFDPLGMVDTAFSVPADKLDRLATAYVANPQTGALEVHDAAVGGHWSRPPAFESGGAGLVSTVDDYLAFGEMMLAKGRCGASRVLSRPAVELMTTNQLSPSQQAGARAFLGDHAGWGFGVGVTNRRDDISNIPGRYGWNGGLGTSGYTDPTEGLIGVLMTQRLMDSPEPPPVFRDFWTSAYQAIDD